MFLWSTFAFISPEVLFSHLKPVYSTMAVKNTHIYGVQLSGQRICKPKN